MDRQKVQAILEWPTATKVPKLPFLLANYYRRFIGGYFKKVALLTDPCLKRTQNGYGRALSGSV